MRATTNFCRRGGGRRGKKENFGSIIREKKREGPAPLELLRPIKAGRGRQKGPVGASGRW